MTFTAFIKTLTELNDTSFSYSINNDKREIILTENGFLDIPDKLIDILEKANTAYEICVDDETGAFMNGYTFDDFGVYETVY